jgi:two-component system cell cycle response regulator DivK
MDRENSNAPTVLVVDDFEDMRSILRLWLEKRGYRVVEAHDGEDALHVARIEHPDVILMDIGMPRRSGISATYKIRKDPELKGVPVVAITAYETVDLHEAAIKAGCVECLCKPIDDDKLGDLLSALLQVPKSN